jgi:predicted HicB family RNase H-like nuclease
MTKSKLSNKNPSTKGGRRRRARIFGERITVSVRMDPSLHERLMDLCDIMKIPANTYIVNLIEADIKKRKK